MNGKLGAMARPQRTNESRLLADRYVIVDLIGSGTAADVFRVRDRQTGVLRAAKVLKSENTAIPRILARFEDEFRILRTLHHPHLPEVYDYGWTDDGGRFLIMELVDGVPLDEYFRKNPADVWAILYELCETLSFVHNHKLLHQDIKPSNILVKRTTAYGPDLPLVKLIDFGLIYKRDAGAAVELVGTPAYVAPEVVRGEASLTRAVDYYSLGATLFELLTGQPPFVGAVRDVLRAQVEREPVIDEEALEWAELYPHVRALLTKDGRARLEAFEELRRAVTSRLTGGIDELDRAYKLARAESTPIRQDAWDDAKQWLDDAVPLSPASNPPKELAIEIVGRTGPVRSRLVDALCAESAIRGCYVLRFGQGAPPGRRDPSDRRQGQVDRFNRALQRIDALHPSAVLLVVNGIELLSDDEASFLRYIVTMQALKREGSRFVFLIARDVGGADHPLDSYLPTERIPVVLPLDRESRSKDGGADDVYYVSAMAKAALESALSESQRNALSYVASHPGPVSREWVRSFSHLSTTEFEEEVDRLITRHLVYPVVMGASGALAASDLARSLGPSIVSPKDHAAIHRDLAKRLEKDGVPGQRRSSVLELIAYHDEAIGEDRRGLVSRIRAIKAAWQERSLSDVERIAQASLSHLVKTRAHSKAARHYFVTQWIRALWARNQHTKAKRAIDEFIVNRGEKIPAALLPKYIRGILDADGPAKALEFVGGIKDLSDQVLLEKALVLCQLTRHDESLALLKVLRRSKVLDVRDRYRVMIYRAMNFLGLGNHRKIEPLLSSASIRARIDNCNDEFVLMSAIRVQAFTVQGHPRDSLRVIARTLPVAHGHEFYLRLNLLYRLAAGAYQDLGQPRKAILSQQRAIPLASALGLGEFEAMSWMRLCEYERVLGNFGNALRYLAKARAIMANSTYEADRARLNLTEMQIHSWLRSPEMHKVIDGAAWIEGISNVNERGRYFMMLGGYWTDNGDWDRAWHCYDNATELLQRTGFTDNLIILGRARLRLALLAGRHQQSLKERRAISAPRLRMALSSSGQLQRNLALLEFVINRRRGWNAVSDLCDACLQQCDDSTEAIVRLEALSLVFRTYARHRRYGEAEAAFRQFYLLLKTATSNMEDKYIAGLMGRLDLTQLTREYDLLEKRNKAGVTTSLVA